MRALLSRGNFPYLLQDHPDSSSLSDHKEKEMKNKTTKPDVKKPSAPIEEQVTEKVAPPAKMKKSKKDDGKAVAASKIKKAKPEKIGKEKVESKDQKAAKEDKLTKFLVSMKKSVRKSIKKEAAEVGVSMNEYIVLAVEEKLGLNSLKRTKSTQKKS
jgi:hypothetical protein